MEKEENQNSTSADQKQDTMKEKENEIKELEDEITRVLTANDPNVPDNTTKYNYKEKAYKQDPEGPMDHLVFHFEMDGCALHKESEEAEKKTTVENLD